MKKYLHIAVLLCMCALCTACKRGNTSIDSFLTDDTVRLEIDGEKVFVFDENKCQLAYNEKRAVFRANTDTMLHYFELDLDSLPTAEGADITGSVYWSTTNGDRSRNNITLNVKSIKGDIIWLCDAGGQTAAVVRLLK